MCLSFVFLFHSGAEQPEDSVHRLPLQTYHQKVSNDNNTVLFFTSRITWKIHESKNHLATLHEARTVILSMIGHVQYLALSHA